VAVGEAENPAVISIYPNPANDCLNIFNRGYPKPCPITILNINGLVVHSAVLNQQNNSIKVSSIAPGIYFIHISTEDGVEVRKFVKR
jgi:hypothetical protein